MNVQLANCTIPIWKLRSGTVILFKNIYCHISSVLAIEGREGVLVGIKHMHDEAEVDSKEVIWLEPH